MKKNPPDLFLVAVTVVSFGVILAAMFSPGTEDTYRLPGSGNVRNNDQPSVAYYQPPGPYPQRYPYPQPVFRQRPRQYPPAAQRFVALQAPISPVNSQGTFQVPEIGAEVAFSPAGELIVTRVYQASHAAMGGLLAGDVILAFGGKEISSPDKFFRAISAASPEAFMEFRVFRSGQLKTLSLMMGKRELDGVIVPPDAAPAHPYALPG